MVGLKFKNMETDLREIIHQYQSLFILFYVFFLCRQFLFYFVSSYDHQCNVVLFEVFCGVLSLGI